MSAPLDNVVAEPAARTALSPAPLTGADLPSGASLTVSDRALLRATGAPLIGGNQVNLLRDGPQVFAAWLRDIATAQHFILFENYIFNNDEVGALLADALCERARAGVHVRLLYDWVGCLGTSRRLWRRMREAGVHVRAFSIPRFIDPIHSLRRDHRKSMVIDGRIGHVGGLCVGDAWAGSLTRGIPPWRDTAVRVVGPAAALLCDAFDETWSLAGPGLAASERPSPETIAPCGDTALRVISGLPGRSRTYRTLQLLLSSATRRLWITDAYFLTPPTLYEALIAAARDGVDVRVLVPGRSDLPWISFLGRAGYVGLLQAGVRIFEWEGPMLHAKTVVIDGHFSRVGSSNLNLASLLTNWELDVLVECPRLAASLEEMFLADLASSSELILRPSRPRFRGRFDRRVPAVAEIDRRVPAVAEIDRRVPAVAEIDRRAPEGIAQAGVEPVAETTGPVTPDGAAWQPRPRRGVGSAPGGRTGAVVARAGAMVLGVALRRQIEQRNFAVSATLGLLLLGLGGLGLWRPAGLGLTIAVLLLWLGVGSLGHALTEWRARRAPARRARRRRRDS